MIRKDKRWRIFAWVLGMAMLSGSCTLYRPSRTHRHHPHHRRAVIIKEKLIATEPIPTSTAIGRYLTMTGAKAYGNTE